MLRHSATRSLFERRDVIVVASISCIYGLGIPSEYLKAAIPTDGHGSQSAPDFAGFSLTGTVVTI